MAHSRNRHSFSLKLFFIIFALAGIGMLVGGIIFMQKSRRFQAIAVEVTGTVVNIETSRSSGGDIRHSVQVSYDYNGQAYEHVRLGFYNSSMYEGMDIPLMIDPDNPRHVASKTGDTFGFSLLLGMGALFAAVGLIPLIGMTVSSRKGKKLLRDGKMLHATVEEIGLNTSISYNGRHPHFIICSYYDSYRDVTYRFKSKNILQLPPYSPGDQIEVYVDPEDYSKYVVNTDNPSTSKVIDYT